MLHFGLCDGNPKIRQISKSKKEDFQHSDDKIGPLREKLMCCSSTSAAIFNHCGLLCVGNSKKAETFR